MYVKTEVRRREDAKREKWSSSCVTNREERWDGQIRHPVDPPLASALAAYLRSRLSRRVSGSPLGTARGAVGHLRGSRPAAPR